VGFVFNLSSLKRIEAQTKTPQRGDAALRKKIKEISCGYFSRPPLLL
jgi:hypothetical protein